MARSVMDNGALPLLYYSPFAVPAHLAPHYVIPQPIPQFVYNPSSTSEYVQSNGEPNFKAVPSQSYQDQYPIHNVVPMDHVNKKEALENALKQPKAQQIIPPGFVARHPLCVMPKGTMLGQPVQCYDRGSYPVYGRLEDVGETNHSHLPFGNQSGAQYVNRHGMPTTAQLSTESQPFGLPAAQPGMCWKLVPVADPDGEEARFASPKPSPAPIMGLKSPEPASNSAPDSAISIDQSDDPYKQILSLLFPKMGEKLQAKDKEDSDKAANKVDPTADSVVPEVEMKSAASPKSVRIIPVTDAETEEKRVVLEGEESLKEREASGSDAKAGPSSVKKQRNKASTLKPIRLIPSLEFAKEKEVKHVNPQKNCEREKEKALAASNTPDEAGPKTENAARAKSLEGLRDVETHTVQQQLRFVEVAARRIQSVYRGYVVRRCQPLKHLRDIARVKSMLKEYQALAADRSSLLEKCKDPAERTKISEGIMSLLLRLDVIQGVDPVVRDIRKYASKEVLKLQSEVDAAMALISNGKVAASVESSIAADSTNESVDHPHDHIVTNGLTTLEDTATENQPQVEEEVADLLRKLLNKLPKSGGEVGDTDEFSDTALISEVVKRLSLLKNKHREKDSNTSRLNNLESSAHIEKPTRSEMRPSENNSTEALPASDSILEPATSGKEAPISESVTELELQNLADTMAAEFVDVVHTHTEGVEQSKENSLDQGRDILYFNDTTVCDDRIGLPRESASVDVSTPEAMIDDEEGPAHIRRVKVQIPDKSFASQEEVDSPTSVLDGVVSVALSEDVSSDGIVEEMKANEEQALQSAISDLQSLNNEGELFLNKESLQLESAISDLHSLNNSGQGFLDGLNPVDGGESVVRYPSVKRITEEVTYPPSLSPETRHVLEGGDVCERLCPSRSETELALSQHFVEENAVLKKLVIDVLKWSQWQSSVTLQLHKMTKNLALEVLETKTAAKKAAKCKQGRKKKNKF